MPRRSAATTDARPASGAKTLREDADADELRFEVTDNGPGFDPSGPQTGTGLQNMRDRVGALDGRISIVTSPGHGTTVLGSIPLHLGQDHRFTPALAHIPDDRDPEHAAPA